ncbi:MAG: STAS domain-containing protein [Thermoanaerobacteraceae bacterium]|uniref:STAS domain-containing protein n=1 Tax=Thermanaeromonas sp. C210 TaxID=2731925 RepID=UPI00155BDCB0|nr:STAS domain-containing protein [Thermanaeromonas sp. C210]MBE3580305.1 STAS domain-containing protein [Thermoanaerobacteraceae bacterium]GFN22862.1 anti-sigma factor antagonist [Thermanaeromonas sp. C210]
MLAISVTKGEHGRRLNLTGELDMETLAMLEQAAELQEGERQLEINLAGVSFIDSTGLRGLLEIRRRWSRQGGEVRVINPCPEIAEVFRLVGVEELLDYSGQGKAAGGES